MFYVIQYHYVIGTVNEKVAVELAHMHTLSFWLLQVLVLSEADTPDMFKAALVSVGLLGVVTEVTLRIEPAFNLHETLEVCWP